MRTTRRRRLQASVVIALLCALAACSPDVTPPDTVAVTDAASTVPPAPRTLACTSRSAHGLRLFRVTSAGTHAEVPLYLPVRYTNTRPVPLLLNLHGSGSNGLRQLRYSGFMRTATRHGFLIAAPNGSARRSWFPGLRHRAGRYYWHVPGATQHGGRAAAASTRDDVRFLRDLITQISAQHCVNPRQVYVAGFSGGARMASALACADAEQIRGIIAVSGLRAGRPDTSGHAPAAGDCRPSAPVSVIAFHGTADRRNPYHGGGSASWRYPVTAALRTWASLDGCATTAAGRRYSRHVRLLTYPHCAVRDGRGTVVELFTITGGGHRWPGNNHRVAYTSGASTREVSVAAVLERYLSDTTS